MFCSCQKCNCDHKKFTYSLCAAIDLYPPVNKDYFHMMFNISNDRGHKVIFSPGYLENKQETNCMPSCLP